MMNDRARELIDPARPGHADRRGDRGAERRAAPHPGRPAQRGRGPGARPAELDRPATRPAACCTSSWPPATSPAAPAHRSRPRPPRCPPRSGPGCCGPSAARPSTGTSSNREWLVLEGEPGTGKATLARATHQARTPAGHFRLLDADDYGPHWIAELDRGAGDRAAAARWCCAHVDRLAARGSPGAGRRRWSRTASRPTPERPVGGATVADRRAVGRRDRGRAAGVLPAHRRGAAAAPPRGGRRRAGAAPDRPADPRLAS